QRPERGQLVAALFVACGPAVVDPAERECPDGEDGQRGEETPRVDRAEEDPHEDEESDGAEDEEARDLQPELESIVVIHPFAGCLRRAYATSSVRDDRGPRNPRGPQVLRRRYLGSEVRSGVVAVVVAGVVRRAVVRAVVRCSSRSAPGGGAGLARGPGGTGA